ncbi:MAG: hypothetical protein [Bacteriophage sp.]|nr:MAG: hypothetical protein [Bacteriophage sp.]
MTTINTVTLENTIKKEILNNHRFINEPDLLINHVIKKYNLPETSQIRRRITVIYDTTIRNFNTNQEKAGIVAL